jgi:hypothetical protein
MHQAPQTEGLPQCLCWDSHVLGFSISSNTVEITPFLPLSFSHLHIGYILTIQIIIMWRFASYVISSYGPLDNAWN